MIIGVAALGSLVWVASDQFDIPLETIAWMFAYTAAAVFSIIVFAAVVSGIWVFLRKLTHRD
ncbi:MAG: hypothetical protein ACJAUG_003059 [Halioglobus sp.]|jgi:hypothetical protein